MPLDGTGCVSQEVGDEQDLDSLSGVPLDGIRYASHKGRLSHTNSLALLAILENLFTFTYTKTGQVLYGYIINDIIFNGYKEKKH